MQGTQAQTCPTSSSDRTAFEQDRLETVDAATYYCSVRIAGTGEVWHQVGHQTILLVIAIVVVNYSFQPWQPHT